MAINGGESFAEKSLEKVKSYLLCADQMHGSNYIIRIQVNACDRADKKLGSY